MNFTDEQEIVIDEIKSILAQLSGEITKSTHTVFFRLKNCDGDEVGEDCCDNQKCIDAQKKNIRASIGKGKRLHEVWINNDGDQDSFQNCCICFRPLTEYLTWVKDEFEHYEANEPTLTAMLEDEAWRLCGLFESLGWCVDKDEALPARIIIYAEKLIKQYKMETKPQVDTQPVPGTGSYKKDTPASSSVKSIEYNALHQKFTIVFKKGATYDYAGVTQKDATAAYHSNSYGALTHNELMAYKGVKRAE